MYDQPLHVIQQFSNGWMDVKVNQFTALDLALRRIEDAYPTSSPEPTPPGQSSPALDGPSIVAAGKRQSQLPPILRPSGWLLHAHDIRASPAVLPR